MSQLKTAFPFQLEGAEWLAGGHRRYLADGMGLGKTIQAIIAASAMKARKVGVVAPASTLENWPKEWAEWGDPTSQVRYPSWAASSGWDATYDLVILDEAHYAKSREAVRTLRALSLARRAGRVICLSGTPMPNHPGELWAPIRALWPEIPADLGIDSYQEWIDRFCDYYMFRRSKWAVPRPVFKGGKNLDQLRPHLKKIMLRRTLDDVGIEMPPLRVTLSRLPKDGSFAREMEKLGIDPAGIEAGMENEHTSRARRFLGIYKAPRIAAQIKQELADGEYEKVVILAHHREVLRVFADVLAPYGVSYFDGETSKVARAKAMGEFKAGARVFVGQQDAVGTGTDGLQAASEIVLAEPSWVAKFNAQYIKRIHRIGTTHPCRARIFAVAGSMDETIMERNTMKIQTALEAGL